MPQQQFKDFAQICIGKLLDGVNDAGRESDVDGLWGPVIINDELILKFFEIELELRNKKGELEKFNQAEGKT